MQLSKIETNHKGMFTGILGKNDLKTLESPRKTLVLDY